MEKKIYTDNLERLLKEKSDEFRMYPSKRVWHSIYNDLHPGRKWPSIAMSMVLVIALLLIGSLNTNDNSVKTSMANASDAQNAVNKNKNTSTQHSPQNDSRNTQQNDLASTNIPSVDNGVNTSAIPGNDVNTTAATDAIAQNQGTVLANSNDPSTNVNDKNASQNTSGRNDLVQSMDYYIKSNQLFSDINELNKQKDGKSTNTTSSLPVKDNPARNENITGIDLANLQNTSSSTSASAIKIPDENKGVAANDNTATKTKQAVSNKTTLDPNDQKAWMEDYALHNKSQRTKWKDRIAMELYVTPSVGYRNLSNNLNNQAVAQSYAASSNPNNRTVSQKPSLNLEAGVGMVYSVAKNLRVNSGVQLNYTSYGINADQTNHPIATTLMLNDPSTGPFLTSRTSTLSNSSGLQSVTVHNSTYQISVPVGLAIKLAGNKKMEWLAGASIQPSFVFGGSTNFISSDYSSYVSDISLLRKWNMNTGVETYLNYKMNGFNLQIGPQFRYQLFSTYSKQYTVNENLYNVGIKVGLVKHF